MIFFLNHIFWPFYKLLIIVKKFSRSTRWHIVFGIFKNFTLFHLNIFVFIHILFLKVHWIKCFLVLIIKNYFIFFKYCYLIFIYFKIFLFILKYVNVFLMIFINHIFIYCYFHHRTCDKPQKPVKSATSTPSHVKWTSLSGHWRPTTHYTYKETCLPLTH